MIGASLAILLAFASQAEPQPGQLKPAFLDSLTTITVALDPPMAEADLKGMFEVTVGGKPVQVKSTTGTGDQVAERRLPRTPGRVVLPGSLQTALGGKEWDPDGEVTQMSEETPGVHTLVVTLPKGRYEYKVARNGSWAENYGKGFEAGGQNLSIEITSPLAIVKFVVDFNKKEILNSIENADRVTAPLEHASLGKPASNLWGAALINLGTPLAPGQVRDEIKVLSRKTGEAWLAYGRTVFDLPQFTYAGTDLGSTWTKTGTKFRVWSPPSKSASVLVFGSPKGGSPTRVPMQSLGKGVWGATLPGDLHGRFYQYEFSSYGETRTAADVYCRSASPDSTRSMVVDLSRTNPPGWSTPKGATNRPQTESIIYEASVRDFTSIAPATQDFARGTYAPLATVAAYYLTNLGITDLHLLPVQNFLSRRGDYTWGYATNLFNVPEETYSATPDNPVGVIKEFKGMVGSLHRAKLRVVLDVVYNHTWPPQGKDSAFWQTVPYYWFRTNAKGDVLNESGVGNALADERVMARKYVRESLVYWTKEYGVDGFRFDLLGMHHPDSVRDWVKAVRAVRPDAVLYGEPWTGGGPTHFPKGAQKGMGIAVFNDWFRGLFRGDLDSDGPGFITGRPASFGELARAVSGSCGAAGDEGFAAEPTESVNYLSAHDNMTLRDRIAAVAGLSDGEKEAAARLAMAAVMLSQGVPFLEGGVEMGRTKGGNHNSYSAGDKVNGFDWGLGQRHQDSVAWLRGLAQLRKGHPAFRLSTKAAVKEALEVDPQGNSPTSVISWRLRKDGDEYWIALNGSRTDAAKGPEGAWEILADGRRAGAGPVGRSRGAYPVPPLSAVVLHRRIARS